MVKHHHNHLRRLNDPWALCDSAFLFFLWPNCFGMMTVVSENITMGFLWRSGTYLALITVCRRQQQGERALSIYEVCILGKLLKYPRECFPAMFVFASRYPSYTQKFLLFPYIESSVSIQIPHIDCFKQANLIILLFL